MFNDEFKNPQPLIEYFNIFSFNDFALELGNQNKRAVFEMTMREPSPGSKWEYFVFFGIKEFVDLVAKWRFDEHMLDALEKAGFLKTPGQRDFYRTWKPDFDIYAISDGDVFFSGEPILRIEGDMLGVNLLTHLCLSFFEYPIRLATKDVRIRSAAQDKPVFYGGGRSQSRDDIYWFNKLTHPLCKNDIVYPSIYTQYPNLHALEGGGTVNLNHAFIKSFDSEFEAFRFGLNKINDFGVFTIMTDTFDYKKGLDLLIEAIYEKGIHKSEELLSKIYVIIDSGDILEQSMYVRERLDSRGLNKAHIIAMSGLDEDDIVSLRERGCRADAYAVITNLINASGCAYLDLVFKTSLIIDEDGTEHPKAKLTPGKESLPGRKNIRRSIHDGRIHDVIVPEDWKSDDSLLLKKVMEKGISLLPDEETLLGSYWKKVKILPQLIGAENVLEHSVTVSGELEALIQSLKVKHGTVSV